MKCRPFLPVAVLASLVLTLAHAQAGTFLRFVNPSPGIPTYVGDSRDATFKGADGWIELQSFSFGTENNLTFSGTGGTPTGKASALPFRLIKPANAASTPILTACVTGGRWDTVEIIHTRSVRERTEIFLKLEFKIVFPTKMELSVSEEPTEEVVLIYAAQRISFFRQDPVNGLPVAAGVVTWSFTRNTATFSS